MYWRKVYPLGHELSDEETILYKDSVTHLAITFLDITDKQITEMRETVIYSGDTHALALNLLGTENPTVLVRFFDGKDLEKFLQMSRPGV